MFRQLLVVFLCLFCLSPAIAQKLSPKPIHPDWKLIADSTYIFTGHFAQEEPKDPKVRQLA